MDYLEMMMLEEEFNYNDLVAVNENAQFRLLPKFRTLKGRYPEIAKYFSQIEKVEESFAKLGKDSPISDINKVLILALNVYTTYLEFANCILIFIPISGWISYIINRGFVLLCEQGAFELSKSNVNKCINAFEKTKVETKDNKVKEQCDKNIKELKDLLNDLNEKKKAVVMSKESATEEFLEMMSLIDEECNDCDDEDSKKKDEDSEEDGEDEGIDEFYSAEACQGKSKGKKVITEEDDEDEDTEDDEDTSVDESGDFRDEFYEDDAEARAALHNDVTEEFLAMMGDIE